MLIEITGNNYLDGNGDKNLKNGAYQFSKKLKKTGRQSLRKSKEIMKGMCQKTLSGYSCVCSRLLSV